MVLRRVGWVGCRLTLAKCLQTPEGMAVLRAELDGGGETDAAMAFLATAIKDHGAVPASNSLFRCAAAQLRSLTLSPLPLYPHACSATYQQQQQ